MNIFQRFILIKSIPKKIENWWAYGSWYMFRSDLYPKKEYRSDYIEYPIEDKFMFNPFNTIGGSEDLIDGLIPAYRHKELIGLYSIGHGYYSSGTGSHSDWASWDNGKHYDLKLKKVITVEEFNEVFPPRRVDVDCSLCGEQVDIRPEQLYQDDIFRKIEEKYYHTDCYYTLRETENINSKI